MHLLTPADKSQNGIGEHAGIQKKKKKRGKLVPNARVRVHLQEKHILKSCTGNGLCR